MSSAAEGIDSAFKRVGLTIITALGIGKLVSEFKGFMKDAVKSATDYEDALADLKTVVDPDAADGLGAKMRELSQVIPLSTVELLKVAETAAKLGIEAPEDIERFTVSVAKIAVATGQQADQVATDFGKIIQITGDSTESMEGLGSAVGALADTMNTGAANIVEAATKSANSLAAVGATTPEIVALAAAMQSISATGKEAAGALKTAADAIGDPKNAERFANALGMTVATFTKMRDEDFVGLLGEIATTLAEGGKGSEQLASILGESAAKLTTLGKNWGEVEEAVTLANEEYRTAGDLQDDFNTKTDTMGTRLALLKASFDDMKVSVGESLAPAMEKLVKLFDENKAGIADFFSVLASGIAGTFTWIVENKELVVGALAAIFAGMLIFQAQNWIATFNPMTFAFQAAAAAAALMGGAIAAAISRIAEMKRWRAEWDAWEQQLKDTEEAAVRANAALAPADVSRVGQHPGLFGTLAADTGIDIEGGFAPTVAQLDAANAARVGKMKAMWAGIGGWIKSTFSMVSRTVDEETGEITEDFTLLGEEVAGGLTDLFQGIGSAFLEQQTLAQEHEKAMQAVRDEEKKSLEEAAALRDKELADIQAKYDAKLISQEEYNTQTEAALAAYTAAQEATKNATIAALDAEEKAYADTKKTTWEILKESVNNVLKALKEELLMKAAAALAEAIALTIGLSPLAVAKYGQAAAYGTGAAGLAIAGFEEGGLVKAGRPVYGVVGEGGVDEAIIPLTPTNLRAFGDAVAKSMQARSYTAEGYPPELRALDIEYSVAVGAFSDYAKQAAALQVQLSAAIAAGKDDQVSSLRAQEEALYRSYEADILAYEEYLQKKTNLLERHLENERNIPGVGWAPESRIMPYGEEPGENDIEVPGYGYVSARDIRPMGAELLYPEKKKPTALQQFFAQLGKIFGFSAGGVVSGPTFGMIGEGAIPEAVLPLSAQTFSGIGRGIAQAMSSPSFALSGAGGIQVDMRGLYDGATINVRDDQDITRIARETHDLWASRMRARGYAV